MTRTIALILVVGSFLGGYYLGQQEGGYDLFAWLNGSSARAADAANPINDAAWDELGSRSHTVRAEPITVEVNGKTYVIGRKYTSDLAPKRQDGER